MMRLEQRGAVALTMGIAVMFLLITLFGHLF